ncbi:MAG TPA: SIMPL domain-containing protein [Candidatus Dormibacteraeota bacterium]|jgi:uncharacterized protein YggE|nr:SIMPL domain-containing protein [Candidatus Dormibacteraeota bacterium]
MTNSHRRTKLLVVAAITAAVALGAGVAGGVAAIVSRSSAQSGPSGAQLFFPMAGPGTGSTAGTGPGQGISSGSTGQSMAMPAPAIGASDSVAMGMPAMTQAGPAASYGMNSPVSPGGWCGGPSSVPPPGPGVTATGVAQVALGGGTSVTAETLNLGVSSSPGATDLASAFNDVQTRLAAVRDAIRKAGVPDTQITQQNLSAWGNGGPKVTNVQVNGGLTVTVTDATLADRAMRAAVDAGASSVNLYASGGASTTTPDTQKLQDAVKKATDEAHTMAQSQAQAAGVQLGALQSSVVQQPSICPWQAGGPVMVAAVTLTYAVR